MELIGGYLIMSIPLVLFALIAWSYEALRRRKMVGPGEAIYLHAIGPFAAWIGEVGAVIGRLILAGGYFVGFCSVWLLGLYLLVRFVKWAWVG